MTTRSVSTRVWVALDRHPDRQTKRLLGRRVRLTAAGLRQGLQGRAPTIYGKVTKVYGLTGDYINVRRNGVKSHGTSYHASFWEAAIA